MMKRLTIFPFGLVGYAIGFGSLVMFTLFAGGLNAMHWLVDA